MRPKHALLLQFRSKGICSRSMVLTGMWVKDKVKYAYIVRQLPDDFVNKNKTGIKRVALSRLLKE